MHPGPGLPDVVDRSSRHRESRVFISFSAYHLAESLSKH